MAVWLHDAQGNYIRTISDALERGPELVSERTTIICSSPALRCVRITILPPTCTREQSAQRVTHCAWIDPISGPP